MSRDCGGEFERLTDGDLDLVPRTAALGLPILSTLDSESDAFVDMVATDELEADEADLRLFRLARS